MISLYYFIRLAVHNLQRQGRRVLIALLCITFGITTLVAMTMIAQSIDKAVRITPAELIGGDISMVRKAGEAIRAEDVAQLNQLRQSGAISQYTLIAYNSSSITFRAAGSGELRFAGLGMGVEPDKYPLSGRLVIGEPQGAALAALLQQVGDVVITRDIALEYHLKVGDPLILADLRAGGPVTGTVRGIAYDTPNHQGDKVYYSLETAQKLANEQVGAAEIIANTVILNTAQPEAVSAELERGGWSVDWVAGRNDGKAANVWVIGLRGAGVLGLLVGGIGVANTMQVLLRRRQRDIAIWKTLGYREGHLRLIFALEAGLLGLAGSLLGAGLGALISGGVMETIRRLSSVLYPWTFSPAPPLMGALVGTLTTVIFALWAILIAGQARPMALLRGEPVTVRPAAGCQSVLLGMLLAVPFTVLTSMVMGSALAGIALLIGVVIAIAGMGGVFSGMIWTCTMWVKSRILPLRAFPLVRMGLTSLHRRGASLVFAMMALFAGVLSMSLGLAVMQFNQLKTSGPTSAFQSYNLNILAPADAEDAVRQAVQAQRPEKASVGYRAALASVKANGERLSGADMVLVGRSDPEDYVIHGAAWGSRPGGVYTNKEANLPEGAQVEITFRDGGTKTLPVVGYYTINYASDNLAPPAGLLMTAQDFTQTARPDSITYFARVAPERVSGAAAELGAALPRATVVNLEAYAARFMHGYQKLFILPMVIAGLALLAGLLLVANSVSLAMLDRRYEIGILKTVGYSRRQVLSTLAVEYGLVGLLATGAGVLFIQAMLAMLALAARLPARVMLLSLPALALVAFCGVGLTVLTAFGAAWEPTGVSPLIVMNDR